MPNFIVNMRRSQLTEIDKSEHAGLLLDRGFSIWAKNPVKENGIITTEQHNNAAHNLHRDSANIEFSELYKKAYDNWKQYHVENGDKSQIWFGELVNRLYLGMGETSPLEAGIILHHTYGVPFIPGSAIKGVLSHFANEIGLSDSVKTILFGTEVNANNKQDSGEAGYIIFNDAWWIPEGKALAPEMITVHAQKYYSNKGKNSPHPDFELPNPNPQIAIQGGFMFTVEGGDEWAEYAMKLLQQAMYNRGVGAKGSSGYGYFEEPVNESEKAAKKWLEETLDKVKKANNISDDKEAYASKPMAEDWSTIKEEELKLGVLNLLQAKWVDNGRNPSKKAQKIYDL